ncbi:MAG: DUF456 domain-containing protein [Treponema sp.]|jgi:uncharacterized protein YqgC (DUF456 family)|nr:DUF456 domain-containing protein [Treponema sp.]
MEIFLVVLAFLFLLAGLLGSVIPAIPGPPLSYVGLLMLQWSGRGGFSSVFLWVWAAITVAVMVIDNFLPALLTKRFGGSRMAVTGSVLGIIVGMFFAPLGLILGPFLGAFAGELIHIRIQNRKMVKSNEVGNNESETVAAKSSPNNKALKVAFGAFLAFILGTGAKLILCSLMIYYAAKAVFFS